MGGIAVYRIIAPGCLFAILLSFFTPGQAHAEESTFKVMAFNIHRGGELRGHPLSQTAKVIRKAKADIVGLQEMRSPKGNNTERLARLLGWNYHMGSNHSAVITPYDIVERYKDGIKVKLPTGQHAYLFSLHLPSNPYQPYQLLGIRPKWHKHWDTPFIQTEAEAIAAAKAARGAKIAQILEQVRSLSDASAPVFVVGDFNEPSHLDWTEAAAKSGRHPIKVEFPNSIAMAQAGFIDAWRKVYPDEMERPGFTWTPSMAVDDPETHHDRIDFIYYKGDDMEVMEVEVIGEDKANADRVVAPYPSDHRAVLASFRLSR